MEHIRWDTPAEGLPGVGQARARALRRLGVEKAGDLLTLYPRRYEDWREGCAVARAPVNVSLRVDAAVTQGPTLARIPGGRQVVRCVAADDTGAVRLTFFNRAYVRTQLVKGKTYAFFGKVDLFGGGRTMVNPRFEDLERPRQAGRLVPCYPLVNGLTNALLVSLAEQVIPLCLPELEDPLPPALREKYHLIDARTACRSIHFPGSWEELEAARRRLSFEELFSLTLGLQLLRTRLADADGTSLPAGDPEEFQTLLPFPLTAAQRRVMEDCARDMSLPRPMNRLCQGDVGSGKTAVAAFCLWRAARSGAQGAMMAPTDLLARQHYATLSALLTPAGVRVALLTASMTAAEKREVKRGLTNGDIQVVVGTHALLTGGVEFQNLAFAAVDEQHRFGVEQRSRLAAKGAHPHLLVLSATPIPRTLALILYGDLDVSLLDQLPPGRKPVDTFLVSTALRQRLYRFMDQLIDQGRQVYVVCPAVEDDDTGLPDLRSVKEYAAQLAREVFPHRRVAFVHGQMKGGDKEKVMAAFAGGELDILVSTTVIEVGVDVPNAALMAVENADRFGLSQLHQLRGRVGRGEHQSWCVLISDAKGRETRARLKALCATADGFKIAEEDLKARGPGDFLGRRQHGLPQMRLADLSADTALMAQAQTAARDLLASDPRLERPEHLALMDRLRSLFAQHPDIFN